jgi:hypothetical protein
VKAFGDRRGLPNVELAQAMPGRRNFLAVRAALGLSALAVGCGRAAPQAPADRVAPAPAAQAGEAREPERADEIPADVPSDHAEEEKLEKKKADAEEPSLSRPPAAGGPLPSDDEQLEQLGREERQFQQALDPEALSCGGALPRRDAICSLAEKICELSPPDYSLSAQEDCDKARSACTDAKAAYRKRCGGS